ncbi:MAG: penicillin-binding protein 2 [Actinomycetota bacterium]
MIDGALRLRVFAFVALVLFGGLIARLWYLQGLEAQREELQQQAQTNVLEEVYEEAPRGRILDRNGRVIVDNKVVEVVTIDRGIVDELDPFVRDDMFLELAIAVSRSGRLTKVGDIIERYGDRSYGPFERVPVAVDVNPELLVFLGERPDQFPGVEVVQRTVRSYPYGSVAAHLLGYVGPITRDEYDARNSLIDPDAEGAKTYQLNHEVGKTGIELVFEDELRGVPGVRFLEVDASRKVVREFDYEPPVPGNDVWLSIDLDLQALAEQELADGLAAARARPPREGEPPNVAAAGSVVAVDPRNGDLLAMASFPTYEPADFVNGITNTQFRELTSEDNFSPILNRAIQGTYAPGSTFKLVTALAALEEGVLGPDGLREASTRYTDTGTYTYSNCVADSSTCLFRSPYTGGGRDVDLPIAMRVSSDTYFYDLAGEGFWIRSSEPDENGLRPDEGIQRWAREFGLGTDSGLQIPYERSGVVPDRDYYDRQFEAGVFAVDGSQWFAGATINLSIGQGELLVTPLQLANTYATFGNGGSLHQPNVATRITDPDGEIVREFGPRVLRDLEIADEFHDPIEEGLLGVTMDSNSDGTGTAYRVFGQADFNVWNWPVAGKTGTAEVDDKADTSLFAAYGPTYRVGSLVDPDTEPEIAISVVMEEAGFGSQSAAPVAAAILEHVANDTVPVVRSIDETARYALGLIIDEGDAVVAQGANG